MTLAWLYQESYCLVLSQHRFLGGVHVEIFVLSSHEVAIKPIGVAQEIQARPFFSEVDHSCFLAIQDQLHPPFKRILHPGGDLFADISRQYH